VTPVFYTYLDAFQKRFERAEHRNEDRAHGAIAGTAPLPAGGD
jgi:hypothetical protein